MRKMKETGLSWLKEIPEDWQISKIKYVATLSPSCDRSELTAESVITYTPMEYIKNGAFINNTEQYGNVPASLTPYQEGDIAMAKVTPCFENGNIAVMEGLANGFGLGSSELIIFRPENIETRFLFYWLRNTAFVERAISTITGTGGLKRISTEFVRNCEIPLPDADEQKKISEYLDQKCSQLDSIIDRQHQVIEKLNTYKLSVITEAVTKGLISDRKVKDSCCEFIGQVPEEWQVMKFGRCVAIKSNLVPPEDYAEYPQISPEHIEKNSGRLLDTYTTVKESGVISGNHLFFEGQIIYSKIRPMLNKVTIASFDGLCSADMYPIETDNHTKFILYMMLSDYFTAQVGLVTENRVKMPKINQNELSSITVALPPMDEQKQIADYLEKKCAAIDSSIAKRQQLIDKLTEYKKSLIFEVVTGKKEV